MTEFLIIMHSEVTFEQVNEAIAAVKSHGGKVSHRYPPRLILGQGEQELLDALSGVKGVTGVYAAPVENPEELGLDEAGLLAVQAWNQRMSDEYRAAKAARPDEGKPWDFHEQRPGGDILPVEDAQAPLAMADVSAKAPPVNTSRYMIGTIAVGVVIVDGPANSSAAFTQAERTNVVAEVQEGTNGLVNLSPVGANLNFVFDVNTVNLTLDPNNVTGEGDWRDAAMAALGYSAGSPGMYDYLHDLRTTRWPAMCPGPDWGYIAFFTKYATSWFAYASLGGPRLVMQYSNDGWGPNQIDRVFAHETGHIFHAPDEYVSSNCSTGGSWGYLGVANGNCAVNNPNSIDCLMKANTYDVCQWTVGHFGWRDTDTDGVPDPIDLVPGTYATDVGITPGTPFYNNAELWIRNQDDGEATQSHQKPISNIDNYIYAKVSNFGGVTAEVVRARFYLADFTGTEFVFPNDYTNLITAPDTPCPTVFALAPGASAMAKVHLRKEQIPPSTWHPCLLVHTECPQEEPVPAGSHVWDSNSLAQKNLVIDYVAPSQTLTLPIMIQNISAEQPFFEIKRVRAPATVKLQLQFQDRRLKPEIIARPPVLRPPIIELIPRLFGSEQQIQGAISLQFLHDTDLAARIPWGSQDLLLHLAAGSAISLAGGVEPEELLEPAQVTSPFERWDRIFFPIPTYPITQFRLPIGPGTRKTAGLSFTAPPDAHIGDEYHCELIQYNENRQPVGGITFLIRVVSRVFTLKEYWWRIRVLRELGLRTRIDRFGDLADAAEALLDRHVAAASGEPADATSRRDTVSALLRETATPDVWGYPVSALAELATSLETTPTFAADLDVLSLLLFHAQERLLAEYAT